jgi:hypothetical protein
LKPTRCIHAAQESAELLVNQEPAQDARANTDFGVAQKTVSRQGQEVLEVARDNDESLKIRSSELGTKLECRSIRFLVRHNAIESTLRPSESIAG